MMDYLAGAASPLTALNICSATRTLPGTGALVPARAASPLTDLNFASAQRPLLEAVALVLAELPSLGDQLLARFFVTTATGQWLDARAGELGLTRVQASPTLRNLTVSHAAGPSVTIP